MLLRPFLRRRRFHNDIVITVDDGQDNIRIPWHVIPSNVSPKDAADLISLGFDCGVSWERKSAKKS